MGLWLACGCAEEPGPPAERVVPALVPEGGRFVPEPEPVVMPKPRCPPDMVRVEPTDAALAGAAKAGWVVKDDTGQQRPAMQEGPMAAYCVDRYESMLVGAATGERISPYYAPSRKAAQSAAKYWDSQRFQFGSPSDQAVPLPTLPAWQLATDFVPRAVSRKGVTPNGHTSGAQAEVACREAGKRLCSAREWRVACGGEQGWAFPYGERYEQGACNVFREGHPAAELHDDASRGHTDPRLNRVAIKGRPLLRKTGETARCASHWEDDAIYDMVGNLDEWLDDPNGAFAGGFYSRSAKSGCDWRATGHPYHYADYSTGVRCCADLP
ncbi:MAG: hypothetical protein R3B72_48950 [Polyangiaceae bacterium]